MIVYICQCYFLNLSHPLLPVLCPPGHSLCRHLHFFSVSRFISTIFLDSLYMHCVYACVCAHLLQSRWTLCNLMDCGLLGSSVHGILQARILECIAMPSSKGSSWPRNWTRISYVSCIGRWVLYHWSHQEALYMPSVQFSSVAQSCPTLCNPTNSSTPGLPVHHQLPESTQTHVHQVGDAIQPSHPLSSPSLPALNLSQHQGLSQWVSSSHQLAKVLEFQLDYQSFQWTPRTDL